MKCSLFHKPKLKFQASLKILDIKKLLKINDNEKF